MRSSVKEFTVPQVIGIHFVQQLISGGLRLIDRRLVPPVWETFLFFGRIKSEPVSLGVNVRFHFRRCQVVSLLVEKRNELPGTPDSWFVSELTYATSFSLKDTEPQNWVGVRLPAGLEKQYFRLL